VKILEENIKENLCDTVLGRIFGGNPQNACKKSSNTKMGLHWTKSLHSQGKKSTV
jgi:hypothetical protein